MGLWNTTATVEIDFGDGSPTEQISEAATHIYAKPGSYTAALRSRGPENQPVTVQMRVVIEAGASAARRTR